jgi:hypothetical protein
MQLELCREIDYLNLTMVNDVAVALEIKPTLESKIREEQREDPKLKEI